MRYTVNDIASTLGIGRGSQYKLANSVLFKTIHRGKMIQFPKDNLKID